ncbi:NAD(P)/FAD-dependent oxidoreductase [Jannaschia aquimarina]|uniref:Mlr_2 protein n=1 Tax=Jannaschia aquimarina TaxID=935700 RepID=A0A0D1EM01_9RHOB|nr:FAD-dependent oxidoreductase [Jannaschia aquimarina]KIT16750.1 4-methylaminobutanoate oxidase (formaldehyde-forming) [Jannaschia aquimarina]SNS53255.1 Glycine/D-amino acid oxidase [Jannaschia aquimarina]
MTDVIIVGGAIMGSSLAWWLTELGHPPQRITVVERDPTYAACGTAFTNSCIRMQFGNPLNVALSRFGVEFLRAFPTRLGDDRVPPIQLHEFGYLYLAGTDAQADRLCAALAVQTEAGAATRLMEPAAIAAEYPFYDLDGVILGSHGARDEGYFDGTTMFEWWRRLARERGVTFLPGEVIAIDASEGRVHGVTLSDGTRLPADIVVNAAGTRGAQVAALAGVAMPVEPRKRYTWVFEAAHPLDRDLPLTIDPSGVHVRTDGPWYMAGATPDPDPAVDPDDFSGDWEIWEDRVWPLIATRIPAFENIRVRQSWVGHYDLNTLDANALLGPVGPEGFVMMNGFSGHGLQHAAGIGRGLAEWIVHGRYVSLDLTPFCPARVARAEPFAELAVI